MTPKEFAADLATIPATEDLTVRICSGGGDVWAAQAIGALLENRIGTVTAQIEGICASAATIVASHCKVVKAAEDATYMIHPIRVNPNGFVDMAGLQQLTVTTDGAALGQKNAAFAWKYTVTDADGDTLTVTEKLDGKTTKTRTGVASGTTMTFEQAADAAGFQRVLNGSHTLTVEVSDGKETTSASATFTKTVHAASVTLAEPLTVEGDITVAVLQVTGSIPDDAVFKAEVTNNAKDAAPVWQDATTEVQKGVNIVFENKTATAGAAFNFRVSVSRGASGTGGYIEAVSGAFQ